MADAFRRTNIDYGRIDYGVSGSAPQVWEINTHPTVAKVDSRLTEAFEAIDTRRGWRSCSDFVSLRDARTDRAREVKSRSCNSNLRTAVSTLASTPVSRTGQTDAEEVDGLVFASIFSSAVSEGAHRTAGGTPALLKFPLPENSGKPLPQWESAFHLSALFDCYKRT